MDPRILVASVALAAVLPASAAVCHVESGGTVAPAVELYTSEGCSSCPPADRWLSARFPPGGRHGVVALAFHVDYWDRLGWKDRFASPQASARQAQAARANRAGFVYTPQVLLQGRDFADWRSERVDAALAAASSRHPEADLEVGVETADDAVSVEIRATLRAAIPGAELFVALVDSGHATDVAAGENRGERLRHDHVVRAFETRLLDARGTTTRVRLPRPSPPGVHLTVVALVQDRTRGTILQAVPVPLDTCR